MTLKEIYDGLENKTIKISDEHRVYLPYFMPSFENYTKRSINNSKMSDVITKIKESLGKVLADGSIMTEEKVKESVNFFESMRLPENINIGDNIFGEDNLFTSKPDIRCEYCGATLDLVLIDNYTLKPIERQYSFKTSQRNIECSRFNKIIKGGYIPTNIEFPSGKVLFKNYFENNETYEMPYDESKISSINYFGGVVELAEYLAEKNIGYGQMGNMSVGVFLKDSGDEIIIAQPYTYSTGDDRRIKGFNHMGTISCSVWRWMCADIQVLEQYNENYPGKIKNDNDSNNYYGDEILLDVKPGKWQIKHYFTVNDNRKDKIYSRLKLIKK